MTRMRVENADGPKDSTVAAIILAGGSSRRYGAGNKLLADIHGVPLIRHVALRVLASRVGLVVVVTGHQRDDIERALTGLPVVCVHNARHLEGMGHTVAAGVVALPDAIQTAVITPGDLPDITPELIDRLLAIHATAGGARIVYATLPTGEQRNPVIWPRRFFPELAALAGDTGARALVKQHAADTMPVALESLDAFVDIDRPEDLEAWRRKHAGTPT